MLYRFSRSRGVRKEIQAIFESANPKYKLGLHVWFMQWMHGVCSTWQSCYFPQQDAKIHSEFIKSVDRSKLFGYPCTIVIFGFQRYQNMFREFIKSVDWSILFGDCCTIVIFGSQGCHEKLPKSHSQILYCHCSTYQYLNMFLCKPNHGII